MRTSQHTPSALNRTLPSSPDHRLEVSRRGALGMAAASTFLFGFRVPLRAESLASSVLAPNAFIKIDDLGNVTLMMPQVEMGQGTYTSISMILAEELDADWSRVKVEHAPPDEKHYANPILGIQATGGSNSIRAFWKPLRQAGANTRAVLVQAAGLQMDLPIDELRTRDSEVIHDKSGRKVAYAALIGRAARIKAVDDAPFKDAKDFRLIGRPLRRLDTLSKTNGAAQYGIDALPAGVKFATIAASPVLGGKVSHVDDTVAKTISGVRQIVVLDNVVGVIGDHMWAAKRGLDALAITWVDGPNGDVTSGEIWDRLRKASVREGAVAKEVGDPGKVMSSGEIVARTYEMPLLAHACMEPMNCTVHVTPDSAEVWIGSQVMERIRQAVANACNLPEEKVTVHNHLIGGGFGRRLETDMAYSAARIAAHVDGPVKVVWTREEDIRHDVYRPAYVDKLSAKLDGDRIVGWKHKITGSSVMSRFIPAFYQKGVDFDGVDSAQDVPYDIPNLRVEFNREEPPGVITGFWRGVGPNNNVFAIESFVDELARTAGKDSIAFRRVNLDKTPRLQAALDLVRDKSGWDSPLRPRIGRGVAVQISFASFIATVVECEVDGYGEIKLRRVTSAVDSGTVVNPDTVIAQFQGGIIFGLTAALYGEITLDKGRVQQSNFHDYRMLRIDQVPPIEVHLIRNGEPPGGIGETGTTAAVPALRNAIYAATGVPLSRMPVDRSLLSKRAHK